MDAQRRNKYDDLRFQHAVRTQVAEYEQGLLVAKDELQVANDRAELLDKQLSLAREEVVTVARRYDEAVEKAKIEAEKAQKLLRGK